MTETDLQLIIHHLVDEAYNHDHLSAIDTLVASPVLINGRPEPAAVLKEAVRILRQVLPDVYVTVDEMNVLSDFVLTHWTFRCRASSDRPKRRSLRLFRITQGRIVEVWFDWAARDRLAAIEELQKIPEDRGDST